MRAGKGTVTKILHFVSSRENLNRCRNIRCQIKFTESFFKRDFGNEVGILNTPCKAFFFFKSTLYAIVS